MDYTEGTKPKKVICPDFELLKIDIMKGAEASCSRKM